MTDKSKAITSLASAFVIGFALCYLLFSFSILNVSRHKRFSPEKFTTSLVQKFTQELSLNESQVTELKIQLAALRARHDTLRVYNEEAARAIRENFRIEFAKVLTPEQQLKYIEFNQREDRRFRR